MIYAPIWKDTYYTSPVDRLDYSILLGDSVIYSGIARRMPNTNNLSVNINKLVRDYLRQDIESLVEGSGSTQINSDAYGDFTLVDSDGNILEEYGFLYDYDKGHQWSGGSVTLSIPVNGEYVDGMLKLNTTVSANHIVSTSSVNGDYGREVCADYVLYYLNARGGWDAFAYTGKCVRSSSIKSYTADRVFNNNTAEFEISRYGSEVVDSWELNTGLMTDEESEVYARHLASSNQAYLHIMEEGLIIPVVITDTSVTYKTQKWEDNGIISYRTMVKSSQKEYRQ